jgi:hypothetical protein
MSGLGDLDELLDQKNVVQGWIKNTMVINKK